MRTTIACLLLGFAILPIAGCTPKIDVRKSLQVVDVTTGWFDAGIIRDAEGEKNRIVPTIAFKLKNTNPDVSLGTLQVNAVFRVEDDLDKEWGTTFVMVRPGDPEGLKPGATSDEVVLKSDRGYTSLEPRLQMLQNSKFVDAVVDIQAKYAAQQWVTLGRFKIDRQLLTY
jgi:hypothetical protein